MVLTRGALVVAIACGCADRGDPAIAGDAAPGDPVDAGAVIADAPRAIAPNVRLADTVIDAPGATGTGFGDGMSAGT